MHKYPTNLTDKQRQVMILCALFWQQPVHSEDRRAVEIASLGFRSVADSVLLFQQVEERGLAGKDLRHPPRHCPPSFGQG